MSGDERIPEHEHSVTRLIQQLQTNHPHAASQLWRRYFERLLPLARAKLAALPHRAVDEEDVLVSVFDRFFEAAQKDRFAQLSDRNDLCRSAHANRRNVFDHFAATRKSAAATQSQRQTSNCARLRACREPGPEFVAAFNESLAAPSAESGTEHARSAPF